MPPDAGPPVTSHDAKLTALRAEVASLKSELHARDQQERVQRRVHAELRDRVDALNRELAESRKDTESARSERRRVEAELANARKRQASLESELDEAQLMTERVAARVQAELDWLGSSLAFVRADIERAASSRSWRVGHRLMSVLGLITFRRARTGHALERAIARIDELESERQRP